MNSIEGMIEEYERRLGGMTIGFLEGLSKRKNKTCRNCEIKYSKEILLLQVLDAFFNVLATLRQCISRWDLEYS